MHRWILVTFPLFLTLSFQTAAADKFNKFNKIPERIAPPSKSEAPVAPKPEKKSKKTKNEKSRTEQSPKAPQCEGDRQLESEFSKLNDNGDKAVVFVKVEDECYAIEFDSSPGEIISCTELLPLIYTQRSCESGNTIEMGKVNGLVACENSQHINLRFRSSESNVAAVLHVIRKTDGRSGTVIRYVVDSSKKEKSSVAKLLPAPELIPLETPPPAESPLSVKVSGMSWFEYESSANFGFDAGTEEQKAIGNFDRDETDAHQENMTMFANLGLDLSKDLTTFSTLIEIGEVYFGDEPSGGGEGAGATNTVELRNFFLDQQLVDGVHVRAGIMSLASDPRAFIYSNHVTSFQISYESDLTEAQVWLANATKSQPGEEHELDQYVGVLGSIGFFSQFRGTVFLTTRHLKNDTLFVETGKNAKGSEVAGDSLFYWYGFTLDYDALNPLAMQTTFIYNTSDTKLENDDQDKTSAFLADARLSYAWTKPQITATFESLMTSGTADSVDSKTGARIKGQEGGFNSPVAASYLLTIATSDGVDDAPGTPKQSIIGELGNPDGLQVSVLTLATNFGKSVTTFLRGGTLGTAEQSEGIESKAKGSEVDFGFIYQLTPSATFQADYARFMPGSYFEKRDAAELSALKLKFSF